MAVFVVPAQAIGDRLTEELRMLLSRAYTDERHLATYPPGERERLARAIAGVRSGAETMPRDWMRRFPTLRNLWLAPGSRLDSQHFLERRGQDLAGHVALFEQEMLFAGFERLVGGYIEDVATDPGFLRLGIATGLVRRAVEHAGAAGLEVLALGTAIPAFYERLGWERWQGTASHERYDGTEVIDAEEMVFALTPTGRELLERHTRGHLFRPARERTA
jgi:GNAT superfamily N-acetyltransferase